MSFAETLKTGRTTESHIARWLMSRGHAVLPAYEIMEQRFKGPQLFTQDDSFVSPDMLIFKGPNIIWVEAKHKTVFTWHRKTNQWTTGIDLHHYSQYMHVSKQTKLPVWLMFFHVESTPDPRDVKYGCPAACPTGLFGGELFSLIAKENHRSPGLNQNEGITGHGKSGMVYWAQSSLTRMANKDDLLGLDAA